MDGALKSEESTMFDDYFRWISHRLFEYDLQALNEKCNQYRKREKEAGTEEKEGANPRSTAEIP